MRVTLLSIILLACSGLILAQQPADLRPCGTPAGKSPWLIKYQQAPAAFAKNMDSTLYIPLTVHVVGNDVGSGFFPLDNVLDALCTLNGDFAPSNIQFYIKDTIRYIKNSSYYNHETILDGANMMLAENVSNTINCYIVNNPAGACGYNLPYAGIALNKACTLPTHHTWAHELGHAFKLPHPFLGWDGAGITYSDSLGITHSFGDPAPTEVYYDYTLFKDSLILDTVIIDTALVEYVDGRNCAIAADGFCDTPPDYLYYRWNCEGTSSTTQQTDPDGVKFRSDGTLFMSYSADNCQSRFSDEQIAAMRANIFDQKSSLLNQDTIGTAIPSTPPVVTAPVESEAVHFQDIQFEWEAVPGAERYVFQISRLPSLGFPEVDTIVAGTSITVPELRSDRTFYWRIRPLSRYSFCTRYSDVQSFETTILTSTQEINAPNSIVVQPNPVAAQQSFELDLVNLANKSIPTQVKIWNANGIPVWERSLLPSEQAITIAAHLPSGFYILQVIQGHRQTTQKLLVQ